jgi:hypothetical protein
MYIFHEIGVGWLSEPSLLQSTSTAANSHGLRKRVPTYASQARTPRVVNDETSVTGYGLT